MWLGEIKHLLGGFPGGWEVKASACNAGDLGREDHWRRKWQPTPVFLPGESHGRRSLVSYSPRGGKVTLYKWYWLALKEGWASNNWCFQTVVLEKPWESRGWQRDQTSQSEKKSILSIHWKDWCWRWSCNALATWCEEPAHWKRPWCWEKLKAKREKEWQRMRW